MPCLWEGAPYRDRHRIQVLMRRGYSTRHGNHTPPRPYLPDPRKMGKVKYIQGRIFIPAFLGSPSRLTTTEFCMVDSWRGNLPTLPTVSSDLSDMHYTRRKQIMKHRTRWAIATHEIAKCKEEDLPKGALDNCALMSDNTASFNLTLGEHHHRSMTCPRNILISKNP